MWTGEVSPSLQACANFSESLRRDSRCNPEDGLTRGKDCPLPSTLSQDGSPTESMFQEMFEIQLIPFTKLSFPFFLSSLFFLGGGS